MYLGLQQLMSPLGYFIRIGSVQLLLALESQV